MLDRCNGSARRNSIVCRAFSIFITSTTLQSFVFVGVSATILTGSTGSDKVAVLPVDTVDTVDTGKVGEGELLGDPKVRALRYTSMYALLGLTVSTSLMVDTE